LRTFLYSKSNVFNPILIGFFLAFSPFNFLNAQTQDSIEISLEIQIRSNSASAQFRKADLKYNKEFAYSFILDDGLVSAYKVALPLFQGGLISPPYTDEWLSDQGGNGSISKGLFYSDGCGHRIPFRASIAINAHKIENDTLAHRGFLSWNEVRTLYHSGWGIMNHGFDHKTQKGSDFKKEIQLNQEAIQAQLGIETHYFIVPGGEGEWNYQNQYTNLAFEQGFTAVGGNTGEAILNISPPFKPEQFVYSRFFLNDKKGKIKPLKNSKKSTLIHAFTHGVGNQNLWGISCTFPQFSQYMVSLESHFGIKGKDNIWMAPTEEIVDYIRIRDHYKMEYKRKDSTLSLILKIPLNLMNQRFRSISLRVIHAKGFRIIGYKGCKNITFNSSSKGLINLDF